VIEQRGIAFCGDSVAHESEARGAEGN
jgi:hypothetical protein